MYFIRDNFLYPAIAVLSVPFLAITIRQIRSDNPIDIHLSNAAAVATIIYVPFAFVPLFWDALIFEVVQQENEISRSNREFTHSSSFSPPFIFSISSA